MNKVLILLIVSINSFAQSFTHADSIRGGQTPERVWWNALKYDISASFDPIQKSIKGSNTITYQPVQSGMNVLQIDLKAPLTIDSVISNKNKLDFTRDGDAWLVKDPSNQNGTRSITIYYHGIPPVAKRPPWDGGVIWTKDLQQNDWISIACQGFGASCWYPNKDQQLDEADSAEIHITVSNDLKAISNGRPSKSPTTSNGNTTYHWKVTNKINNYNIIPYIGKYESFGGSFRGKAGNLDITYWALQQDLKTAKRYWPSRMKESLKSLEHWFGPYPFYKDGFKLVQAPHLGMEHQGAIAYGNGFQHGYLARDLSGTGWGLKWDFIILHETAHEWFGNSITAADVADMWIHEAFATYAEVLYIEERWGREAGVDYLVGRRQTIQNDEPIIGPYGVNTEGSGDMYTKGANMIHIMRLIIDDDEKFKTALLDMNKKFYHKQVNTEDMLTFWNSYSKYDLKPVFDQYLRTAKPPTLKYKIENGVLGYQWVDCVPGFNMPIKTDVGNRTVWIQPTTEYQETIPPMSPQFDPKPKKEHIKGINREFYIMLSSGS